MNQAMRMMGRGIKVAAGLLAVGMISIFGPVQAAPGDTTLLTGHGPGLESFSANGGSLNAVVSADGRYMAFESVASNLVSGDTNGRSDIFVHDRQTGVTTRVSVDSAGVQGDIQSQEPALSADGRYAAFQSFASNLVAGDTNGETDIFIHDRLTSLTTRVSVDSVGGQGNNRSRAPALSADGRYVAFFSFASNLVTDDVNGEWDIFVHDRQTGTTTRRDVGAGFGLFQTQTFDAPSMSADGRYVAFPYYSSNLVTGDTNGQEDIFVHDGQTGATTRVSVDSAGEQGDNASYGPALSSDGRYVAFQSYARNLVAGDTNDAPDIFVHDRNTSTTTRVSVGLAGAQGEYRAGHFKPALSADGRYVSFISFASNLVVGDTNNQADIFVHDRQTGVTTRESVDSTGLQGLTLGYRPQVSPDGQHVAFTSTNETLVTGDGNGHADVFVHDRQTGTTTLGSAVDINAPAMPAITGGGQSSTPRVSADGQYVAFESYAGNLVSGDTNGKRDVFVYDRASGSTTLVSVDSAGEQGDNASLGPALSSDGRYVAFQSSATNLVSGDTNGQEDVFMYDRAAGLTTLVSVDSAGVQGNNSSSQPALSAEGRYVSFTSSAGNLVVGDTNNQADIFVHDRQNGVTTRVSVDSAGLQGNSNSLKPSLSEDGRYVAFESSATNLVTGDTNNVSDIFVHDRNTGATTRVSLGAAGAQGNAVSSEPTLSADGRYVAFSSPATNLVTGDTNNLYDIFVHDRQTGVTKRMSVGSLGQQGSHHSLRPGLSADGRYVAFWSDASELRNGSFSSVGGDIHVHNNQTGATTLVSVNSAGQAGNRASFQAALSGDGRHVAFQSLASNLADGDTNGHDDVFLHEQFSFSTGPVANTQSVSTNENQPLAITLAGSDWGNNPPLTFTVETNPTNGALSGTAPNLTYTPNTDFFGADSFSFSVDNGTETSAVAAVSISVYNVNNPPIGTPQSVNTGVNTPVSIILSGTDADNDSLFFALDQYPTNGSISGSEPNLTYTPNPGFAGLDSFTFWVYDDYFDTVAPTTVNITVANDAPTATTQSVSTDENTPLSITLTGMDPNSDPLTFAVVNSPANGVLSGTAPNLTYTPTTNFDGTDSFTFTVNDGTVTSAAATVSITVTAVVGTSQITGASVPVSQAQVDLTAVGLLDWKHWGLVTASSVNRKTGTSLISDLTVTGAAALRWAPASPTAPWSTLRWNDGTPTATTPGFNGGVYFGSGNSYAFTVPADTQVRTLTVYLGGFQSRSRIEATLSDGSAPMYVETMENLAGVDARAVTVVYAAGSAGQTLTFRQVRENASGNIGLQGATLSGPPANQAPILAAIANQAVQVGNTLSFVTSATDADGPGPLLMTIASSTPALPVGASYVDGGTGNATFTWTPTTGEQGLYTVTFRAQESGAGGLSATRTVQINVTVPGSGELTGGSVSVSQAQVDLTAVGLLDWKHWGLVTASSVNRKTGTSLISDLTVTGAAALRWAPASPTAPWSTLRWNDGTPTATTPGFNGGVYFGSGNSYAFTVPADTQVRTLTVYLGGFQSRSRIEATLSDGSAPMYVETMENLAGVDARAVTVVYAAGSAGQTLTFRQVRENASGNIGLQGATLSGPPANQAPILAAIANQAVQVGNTLSFVTSATDADGPGPLLMTIASSTPALPVGASYVDGGTGNATFTWTPTTGEQGLYTVTFRAQESGAGGLSATRTVQINVTVPGSGELTGGSVSVSQAQVDLTAVGLLDWKHWGLVTASSVNRKTGTSLISDLTVTGAAALRWAPASPTAPWSTLRWNDGTPTATTPGFNGGVYFGSGNSYAFTVPADTQVRTLTVYLGGFQSRSRIEATLSDGSAPMYVETMENLAGVDARAVTVVYAAGSAGQTLTFRQVRENASGNIGLQGATLQ